jgi:hypothetical protein
MTPAARGPIEPAAGEADLLALDLFERLADRPGDTGFRVRLLTGRSMAVLARLARLEAGHAARAAMPTEPPEAPGRPPPPRPDRIGPFRLAGLVGEGGMGEVWRGERDDGLFEQTVAIKLIRARLDDATLRAFDSERRILARLEHPDIVRLIDGGVTPEGLPYLIMAFIDGAPFDEATARLALRDRTELFLQAARAVQFAHGRLIAHADLKPSNILVDAGGRIRLLDFGIAGLISGDGGAERPLGALTPAYASPERLAGAAPSIADDVYGLGRILQEATAGAGDVDLSAIVGRATAAVEAERYGTVAALIGDLERWRAGQTVSARRDTLAYRARKFAGRHRLTLTATSVALAALLATTVAATVNAARAERARAEAAARFDDARGAARYLLFTLMDRLEDRPNTLALRGEVADVAQHYLDRLAHTPHAPPGVRLEAARGLIRLAEVRGVAGYPNLADPRGAVRNLDRALALIGGDDAGEAPALAVTALIRRARVESFVDHAADKALATLARADRILAAHPALPAMLRGEVLGERAAALRWRNDFRGEIPMARAALNALPSGSGLDLLLERAKAMDLLAEATFYAVDAAAAVPPYRETVTILENAQRLYPASRLVTLRLARARWALGSTLLSMQKDAEALGILSADADDLKAMVAFDADDLEAARQLQVVVLDQAEALTDVKRVDEGVALMKANIADRRRWLARYPGEPRRLRDLAIGIEQLGDIETRNGRVAEGCAAYVEFHALVARLATMGDLAGMDMDDTLDDLAAQARRYCQPRRHGGA